MDDLKPRVLIVDDEPNALTVLSAILSEEGYVVLKARDVESAKKIIQREEVDTVVTDLKMPGEDGMNLFEYITENYPEIPVIFLTAHGTVDSAVSAITQGAFYYFVKPPDYLKLRSILARAIEQRRLKSKVRLLQEKLLIAQRGCVIGNSPGMIKIFNLIEAVKDAASSVLICGETGTGKELAAKALHYSGSKAEKPFITLNCAAVPRDLMEAELFGYEKGAFTGAFSRRLGRFEEASGGTIFLDEIGELELPLQAKLLRVLQEREVERLGSSQKIEVDFRLVCSTNRDLQREVYNKNFREDLFYRINVVQIDIPPLRERREDIPLLLKEFVNSFCAREKKTLKVADEVIELFLDYQWPGNVRQLKNVVERAVVLANGSEITLRELPKELRDYGGNREIFQSGKTEGGKTLKEMEMQAIRETLHDCKGNKSKAAKILGISRKAFYKRLHEFSD